MGYNDYDDEVERMRSRKSRAAGRRAAANQPARGRRRYEDEPEEYYDGDEADGEWLDEDYDEAGEAYDDDEYDDGDDGLEAVYLDEKPSTRPVRGRSAAASGRSAAQGRAVGTASGARASGNRRSGQARPQSGRSQGSRGRQEAQTAQAAGPRRRQTRQMEADDMEERGRKRPARRKKRRIGKLIRNVLVLALVLWVGSMAWAFFHKQTGTWTVAVFGVDSRDGGVEKNALADVQMICTVDRATGEIKLVSVYRDTYLKINSEGTYHKINEAYFKGGHKQAVQALEENLDLSIDNYATFNWKAVADAINILGGIDLEITGPEFKYINAFITETVESTGIGSHHLESAGPNHLDGVQAVAYCRLRLMDTDYQRTERQRKVVSLALDKAKQADTKTLVSLVSAVLPQLSTDVGMDDVLPMAKNVSKYHLGETGGFPFSRQAKKIGRMDCVIPTTLESNVVQLHQFLYGEENYRPSSAVKKISQKISEDSGLYEEGKPAPTGGFGGSGGGTKPAPAPTNPPATEAPTETVPEETTEEETMEETTEAESESAEETEGETEEIGPGVTPTTGSHENGEGSGQSEKPSGSGGNNSERPTKEPSKESSAAAPGNGGGSAGGSSTSGGSGSGSTSGTGGPGGGSGGSGSGSANDSGSSGGPGGNGGSGSSNSSDGPNGSGGPSAPTAPVSQTSPGGQGGHAESSGGPGSN